MIPAGKAWRAKGHAQLDSAPPALLPFAVQAQGFTAECSCKALRTCPESSKATGARTPTREVGTESQGAGQEPFPSMPSLALALGSENWPSETPARHRARVQPPSPAGTHGLLPRGTGPQGASPDPPCGDVSPSSAHVQCTGSTANAQTASLSAAQQATSAGFPSGEWRAKSHHRQQARGGGTAKRNGW